MAGRQLAGDGRARKKGRANTFDKMIIRIDAGILTADCSDNTDGPEKRCKKGEFYILIRVIRAKRVDFSSNSEGRASARATLDHWVRRIADVSACLQYARCSA